MSYNLFIDDERFPPNDGKRWVIARTPWDACRIISTRGFPQFISFDHDLGIANGDALTSISIINWFTDYVVDGILTIPSGFDYYVHSQNPIGAANIRGKMDELIKYFGSK